MVDKSFEQENQGREIRLRVKTILPSADTATGDLAAACHPARRLRGITQSRRAHPRSFYPDPKISDIGYLGSGYLDIWCQSKIFRIFGVRVKTILQLAYTAKDYLVAPLEFVDEEQPKVAGLTVEVFTLSLNILTGSRNGNKSCVRYKILEMPCMW
jgi:hypothetical protein